MHQPGGTAGRRRVSVQHTRSAGASAASVWEARMRMDEVKGGVKVFSAGAGDEPADEEGMRVYRRLRRNQSEGAGGGVGGGATASSAAKKRRNWKASEPVTAIGELRKSRSDASAAAAPSTTVVARRAVTRVSTPEKKVAAVAAGEVKEVVVVEVAKASPLEESKNVAEEEAEDLDDVEDEFDEDFETEEEEEKEVVDQDHMAIDEEESALHQVDDDQDLEPPTKGIKPTPVEDEQAPNLVSVKPFPEKKLMAAIDLRAINPEPMIPPPVEKKAAPIIVHRMTNVEPAKPSPEKKALPAIGRRIPKQEPVSTPPEYEEIQGRPSAPRSGNRRMQNLVDLVMWRDVSKSALVFGLGTFLLISSSYAKDINFNTITAASYGGLIYLGLRFLRKSILNRGENVDCDDDERNGERCYMVGEEEAIWLLRLVLPYINEVILNLRSLFSGEPATTMKLALLLFAMARCGNFVTLWTLAKLGAVVIGKADGICYWHEHGINLMFVGTTSMKSLVHVQLKCSLGSSSFRRCAPPTPRSWRDTRRFWLERFRDAWESCSHKKAVVAAVFTLVWNVSSTVARVWAVFMLVVAMKCYQQRMVEFGWSSTVEEGAQEADGEHREDPPARSAPVRAGQEEAQVFGAAVPRHRRAPVSGEFARERLRVRGGIQPR
ncbi:hypothetical protein ACP70R_022357 [Stipagrostis hirtigluma subsp. patula]